MPNNHPEGGFEFEAKLAAVDTTVGRLDRDMRGISDRMGSLETKFDNVASALASEFRLGLQSLTKQISDRGAPKWGVIITGIGVSASIIGMIGGLVWYPVSNGLNELKTSIVPRVEHERIYHDYDRRFKGVEARIDRTETRAYDEMLRDMERLRSEHREAERKLFELQRSAK